MANVATYTSPYDLVEMKNDQPMTTSLKVAQVFGKRHDAVIRDIRNLNCSVKFGLHNFVESIYVNSQGRKMPCYDITRDGFSFLVMGFTGKEAAQWKERYIEAFNMMESRLKEKDPDFAAVMSQLTSLTGMVQGVVEQNTVMKPKAELADTLTSNMTLFKLSTIADELGMAARELGNRLCGRLLEAHWAGQWRNIPMKSAIEMGLVVPMKDRWIYRFTPRGRETVLAMFKEV